LKGRGKLCDRLCIFNHYTRVLTNGFSTAGGLRRNYRKAAGKCFYQNKGAGFVPRWKNKAICGAHQLRKIGSKIQKMHSIRKSKVICKRWPGAPSDPPCNRKVDIREHHE
jgi:hypothetical protein